MAFVGAEKFSEFYIILEHVPAYGNSVPAFHSLHHPCQQTCFLILFYTPPLLTIKQISWQRNEQSTADGISSGNSSGFNTEYSSGFNTDYKSSEPL